MKHLFKHTVIKDFSYMLLFGALSYVLGLVQFQLPGTEGAITDLREAPLLISIFYLSNPIYVIGLSLITALGTPAEGSYLSSFLMHVVPLFISWYIYNNLKKRKIKNLHITIFWVFYVFVFYFLLLIPIFIITNYLFGLNLDRGFLSFYKETITNTRIEQISVSIISSLYLMQFNFKNELKKHKNSLQLVIKEKTKELTNNRDKLLLQNNNYKALNKKHKKQNTLLERQRHIDAEKVVLSELIKKSLDEKISLNDFLQYVLDSVLKIPWLSIETQGAIFLKNNDGNLEMVAKHKIGDHRIEHCSLVIAGECICGQAITEKKSYIGDFRSKFEKKTDSIPYIHMKKPIMFGNEVLGLLNLYLEKEKGIKEGEIAFFDTVCNSLASIIYQKQLKISLEHQKKEQDILNQKLFAQSLKVDQKSIEITQINSLLNTQKKELQTTVNELGLAKEEIEYQHKNITDSINYAKSIQEALLTRTELIDSYFSGTHFILFKPKQIVSGDFYYVNKVDNNLIFAVADCTGHGVPGGFISMLGITYIHGIIRRHETDNPGEALNILRKRIKEIFETFGSDNSNGLDIAFCSVNTDTNILQYAGAYNPLWIIRNGEFIEVKATRNPIGFYPKEKPFANNEIQLKNKDKIYIFSDGYKDQFGGQKNKTYTNKKFRELIINISHLPMKEQNKILETNLIEWKGENEQIDDITILGLEYVFA